MQEMVCSESWELHVSTDQVKLPQSIFWTEKKRSVCKAQSCRCVGLGQSVGTNSATLSQILVL